MAGLRPRSPMATIYPEQQRYHRPDSDAERKLYPLFAALPGDYTVYCNSHWHAPPKNGRAPRPAEADFLVAHPDRGVLVVEVKGGAIRYDPQTDQWYSNDNRLKRSPFKQVQRTRFLLLDTLEAGHAREIKFHTGEAVAFPDITLKSHDLRAGDIRERVMDGNDIAKFEDALVQAFDTWDLDGNRGTFGPRGVKAVTDAFAAPIHVERSTAQQLQEAEQQLIQLTENQYEVLDALDGNPRMLVVGGAGTGKTLLAMQQARRLAAQGHSVLLTCFNRPLADYMKEQVAAHASVEVMNFHLLCRVWGHDGGFDTNQGRDESDQDYYARLPTVLMEAAGKLDHRYDAILIDEAQDFDPDWLTILQLLLRDEKKGIFFLFADENQAIYRRDFVEPEGFPRYHLNSNLRNTGAIQGLLARHFDEQSRAKGPEGIDVTVRTWQTEKGLRDSVSGILTSFKENGIPAAWVTILTGRSADSSVLCQDGGKLGMFRVLKKPSGPNDIRLESVRRFKGLESPVVLLVEMEGLSPDARRSLWYTGLSRARTGLVVFIHDPDGTLEELDLDELIERALSA